MAKKWWPFLVSVALCCLIYIPNLNAPLIWDDYGTIVLNTEIEKTVHLKDFFTPKYFDFSKEQSWRPMATLSYYVLLRIRGKTPWLLRSLLLSAHLINGFLLYLFLASCAIPPQVAIWAPAFFLIHAAHTETLMCLSFNEELLVTLGLLSMLIAHRKQKPLLAAAGYAFAVASKETGILGLPLLLLCDVFIPSAFSFSSLRAGPSPSPSDRTGHGAEQASSHRLEYGLLACISTAYLWIRFIYLKGPESGSGASLAIPYMERLFFGLSGFVTACRVFFLPRWLRIEYFAVPAGSSLEAAAWVISGLLALVFLTYGFVHLWKTNRATAYFLAWPFVFLALTSNVIPTQLLNLRLMAERWLYLPYLGACVVLAHVLFGNAAGKRNGKRSLIAVAIVALWSGLGFARTLDWADEPRLWASLARIYPWSAKAHEGLGEAYFRRGMYEDALKSFQAAAWLRESRQDRVLAYYIPLERDQMLKWDNPALFRWVGRTYLKLGDLKDAEGSSWKAVSLDPKDNYTYRMMAYSLAKANDFPHAGQWVDQGLRYYPSDDILRRLRSDITRRKVSFQADFF